jgi:sec-independent protein translocase protein TatA
MPNIGPLELVILLVILLVIFGPKRLPGLGRQLGTGMREFKESITGRDRDEEEERRDRLPASAAATPDAEPRRETVAADAGLEDRPARRAD